MGRSPWSTESACRQRRCRRPPSTSRTDAHAQPTLARSRPRNLTGMPTVPRTFVVHTFGCQMNEHDSQRIAGLFEADGLTQATASDDADVIVLNTCCIRENADNKLYGHLGHLKSLKQARPGVQIVVSGCLAQKDREL